MATLLSQSFCLPDGRVLAYAEYGAPDGSAGHMDSPEARASLPLMSWLMWGLAARSVRLTGLLQNLTKPNLQADVAKIRKQMLHTMPPEEAVIRPWDFRLDELSCT